MHFTVLGSQDIYSLCTRINLELPVDIMNGRMFLRVIKKCFKTLVGQKTFLLKFVLPPRNQLQPTDTESHLQNLNLK